MSAVARILDVNVNRAREALRMMEDAARFALNDASLCGELKAIRHELRSIAATFPPGWLEANRNTPDDVGTAISTPSEMHRADLFDAVSAAGKRLGESLRVIEEMCKVNDGCSTFIRPQMASTSSRVEALRYRAYTAELLLQLRFGSGRAVQWKVCVLLTVALCKHPWQEVLCAAIQGGADCVQVREKEMTIRDLVQHVREVVSIVKSQAADGLGATVIVNDRVDVALAAGADGVHVGQHDLSVHDVRRIAGRSLIVGVSTHNLDEARAAADAGADYCGVGAMFTTSIKPDAQPSGPKYLQEFISHCSNMPHLAIGGITTENVNQLIAAGARGVAMSAAVCGADDPKQIVQFIRAALDSASLSQAASK